MNLLQENTSNILFSVCPTRPVQTVCILKHFAISDVFKSVTSDVSQYVVRTTPSAVILFLVTMPETTCRGEDWSFRVKSILLTGHC